MLIFFSILIIFWILYDKFIVPIKFKNKTLHILNTMLYEFTFRIKSVLLIIVAVLIIQILKFLGNVLRIKRIKKYLDTIL